MTNPLALPSDFSDLMQLAAHWARPSENARSAVRWSASAAEFEAFYSVFMPRLQSVLDYLAKFEVENMPADARNLYYLAAAFAEAAPHHELYGGSATVPHSFDARRFVPAHGDQV